MQKIFKEKALNGVETILVVDDEKMILEVTKELLESLGYRVYVAQSGPEAIDVYVKNKEQINMVILDMVLPGMSGSKIFDCLQDINPDIRVLLASGYSINSEAEHILARGCRGFLPKPFRLKDLAVKVRETLS
ncbi:MAG: response regulator [Smithella sp.]